MSAGFSVEVILEDGMEERILHARIDGRDIRAWESAHDDAWPQRVARYSDIEWLSWHALHRAQALTCSYAEFQRICAQAAVQEDEPTDPTQQDRTGDSSSS